MRNSFLLMALLRFLPISAKPLPSSVDTLQPFVDKHELAGAVVLVADILAGAGKRKACLRTGRGRSLQNERSDHSVIGIRVPSSSPWYSYLPTPVKH